jgi:HK97 family phage portal protein
MMSKVKAKKPRTLAPKTQPPDVEQNQSRGFVLSTRQAGVVVNEDTALTLGAVWACVRVISESLAGLPWNPYRVRSDGGKDKLLQHPTNWLLDMQPNDETAAFQWRETLIAHALTWGNGYAEIERNPYTGQPVALWQITPDRVEVMRINGQIIYEVHNYNAAPSYLNASQMFHLKGLGFDGLVGYPVIRLASRTIAAGIATEEATSQFFQNDSTPGGILSTEKTLKPEARNNVRESWEKMHAGPKNRRKVAILEEGLKWSQTGLPPEDAQLLEQRQFTPTEIARWFRVPPHKIADLTRSTNNNIEHQSIEFVDDCLRPWAERLESEADTKLYGRNNQGSIVTVIDLNEIKRGDMASQTAFIEKLSDRGVFSVDDSRTFLGLNPIGKAAGGDKRFVMLNMQLLEKAGEEPVVAEPVPKSEKETQEEPSKSNDETELKVREQDIIPVIEDACRRMCSLEKGGAKLAGEALSKWDAGFRERCKNILRPCSRLLATLHCHQADIASETAVNTFVDSYAVGSADHTQIALKVRCTIIAACAALKGIA